MHVKEGGTTERKSIKAKNKKIIIIEVNQPFLLSDAEVELDRLLVVEASTPSGSNV